MFLIVSGSLFAGRGNQQSTVEFQGKGNQQSTVEFQGRGRYTSEKRDVDDVSRFISKETRSQRMNQVQSAPNSEDCLYLDSGERQLGHQEENRQRNNQQQVDQQKRINRQNNAQQEEGIRNLSRQSHTEVMSNGRNSSQNNRPSRVR